VIPRALAGLRRVRERRGRRARRGSLRASPSGRVYAPHSIERKCGILDHESRFSPFKHASGRIYENGPLRDAGRSMAAHGAAHRNTRGLNLRPSRSRNLPPPRRYHSASRRELATIIHPKAFVSVELHLLMVSPKVGGLPLPKKTPDTRSCASRIWVTFSTWSISAAPGCKAAVFWLTQQTKKRSCNAGRLYLPRTCRAEFSIHRRAGGRRAACTRYAA